ncbi:G patch domain-containing protein 2 [Rhizophlyctis rosea]|nr:G patch domain-containing protein 2 [Rhizophlyctis rosea]
MEDDNLFVIDTKGDPMLVDIPSTSQFTSQVVSAQTAFPLQVDDELFIIDSKGDQAVEPARIMELLEAASALGASAPSRVEPDLSFEGEVMGDDIDIAPFGRKRRQPKHGKKGGRGGRGSEQRSGRGGAVTSSFSRELPADVAQNDEEPRLAANSGMDLEEDFVSLAGGKNSRKRGGRKGRRGRGGRLQGGQRRREDDADLDEETMAIAMDYIQNASEADIASMTALAALELSDGHESTDGEGMAESGMYDHLLDVSNSDGHSSEDGLDSDDDVVFVGNRLWDPSTSDEGALTTYSDEESDGDRVDFEGKRSTWDDTSPRAAREARQSRAKFDMVLEGKFRTKDLLASAEFHAAGKNQRRRMREDMTRARKAEKRAHRQQSEAQVAELNNILVAQRGDPNASAPLISFLKRQNTGIYDFVSDDTRDRMKLCPMPQALRKVMEKVALRYGLVVKNFGRNSTKHLVLYKQRATAAPKDWQNLVNHVISADGYQLKGGLKPIDYAGDQQRRQANRDKRAAKMAMEGRPAKVKKPKEPDNRILTKARVGEVVGGNAKPVGEGNVGHRMLMAMGWKPGQTLGREGTGILNPVDVTVRSRGAGLGLEMHEQNG